MKLLVIIVFQWMIYVEFIKQKGTLQSKQLLKNKMLIPIYPVEDTFIASDCLDCCRLNLTLLDKNGNTSKHQKVGYFGNLVVDMFIYNDRTIILNL